MDNAVVVTDESTSPAAGRRLRRPLRDRVWPIIPLAFVGWWLVGALPWVVTGLHVTPHLTTARETPPDPYTSTLPFITSQLPLLVTLALSGGAVASFATLWSAPRSRRRLRRAVAAAVGLLAATAYTVVQSAGAARQSAGTFDGDARVLRLLVVLALACSVTGYVLGLCVAYGGPVLRALATAPLAVLAVSWLSALTVALLGPVAAYGFVGQTPWVVGVLLGLALAPVGLRPARRVLVWAVALLGVWLIDAAVVALVNVTVLLRPGYGLPGSLPEVADAAVDVFGQALLAHRPGPLLLALATGIVGSVLLPRLRAGTNGTEADPARDGGVAGPAARHTDDVRAR